MGWTQTLDNEQGNVGLADGSVQMVATAQLRRQLAEANRQNKIGVTRVQLPVVTSASTTN